ncbi:MAG: hypothetical protein H6Q73_3776 [Firmicutes bacterium]|nr:hypothetical protein [Bacillota bacterium]
MLGRVKGWIIGDLAWYEVAGAILVCLLCMINL